jgi:short-subunit dehydrogenase
MPNQLAVVTGASSGIGFNLAKVFAENGFDLILCAEDERLNSAAAELQQLGVSVHPVQADLATYDGVESFWSAVESSGRTIDAVALNAGIGSGGLFAETDLDKEIQLVRLNVEGTVHLAKHVVRKLVAQKHGRILFTASIASEMVAPREAVYAASKAFDLSLARSLRYELEDTGVTVTALQPGPTDTDFFHRAGMDNTKVGSEGKSDNQPYDVAKQGFQALMEGKDHVYAADFKTKIEGATAGITPPGLKASMHEKMPSRSTKQVSGSLNSRSGLQRML